MLHAAKLAIRGIFGYLRSIFKYFIFYFDFLGIIAIFKQQGGCVRAKVIAYKDFIKLCRGSEIQRSEAMREGKDYVVQDGDVMRFELMCR